MCEGGEEGWGHSLTAGHTGRILDADGNHRESTSIPTAYDF